MNTSPLARSLTDQLECEFIPALDAPEAWGPHWERHLSIVMAWQEAGANRDGEAAQWVERTGEVVVPSLDEVGRAAESEYGGGGGGGRRELDMRTIVRMNTLLVSLRERMLQITTEASNIAVAEMARRQDAAGASEPSVSLQPLGEESAQRVLQLSRAWFDIVAAAQAGMTALTGVSARNAAAGETHTPAGRRIGERRQRSVVIDFADRRLAA